MRNTTLTTLLGLVLACTLVFVAPSPVSAASPDLTVAPADSWSPMGLLSDLQDWWTALVGPADQDVKRAHIEDPNGAPTSTTAAGVADFPADPEKGLVIDPDGAS